MARKPKTPMQPAPMPRPFVSLADRRKWMATKFSGVFKADPAYYNPMLKPGPEGKEKYLERFAGVWGCGKKDQPSDLELFSVLINITLPEGLDDKVMLHCDTCLPCLVRLGRAYHHFVFDRPGSEWSEEIGKRFPFKVKGWENDNWHFRLHITSVYNGPGFHVYKSPYEVDNKTKNQKQFIIGSAAGILGLDDCPLRELVLSSQKEMEARARESGELMAALDPSLIVQFARGLGFDVDNEIYDFLKVEVPAPPKG